jgi:hypothetical protein
MASYFGDEPTCTRCDYPARLHHLLNMAHEYTPGSRDTKTSNGTGHAAATAFVTSAVENTRSAP